jgi:shikimate 5-dehydrogenase
MYDLERGQACRLVGFAYSLNRELATSMRFADKVVLVAGGGLGRAVSLAFLEEGAEVIVSYRKDEEFVALLL